MTLSPALQVLAFDGFYVDPRQRLLFNESGENLPLPSRAFDTLLFMAQHPNELLDKQRLMKAVWPQTNVEENNLSQHISLIRKVLGEAPNQHRFIVTVPGRGFRFVPQVRALDELPWAVPDKPADLPLQQPATAGAGAGAGSVPESESQRRPRWYLGGALAAAAALLVIVGFKVLGESQPAAIAAPSLAVLAFADMSPGQDHEPFSDGLSDALIYQLEQVPQLRVIGRTSSFAFKGRNDDSRRIGEILGVSHLLEGSVRKAGDRIRISVRLINAADGSPLWSEIYESDLDDTSAIQDEISHTVAARLQLKLDTQDLNAGGTRNTEAYEEFLAGRARLASTDGATVREAVPFLERAVTLDPDFMTARLWLIDAYLRTALGRSELKEAAIRKQEAAIDEVVKLAKGRPEASLALSYRSARGRDLVELARLLEDAMRVKGSPGARAQMRYGQFLVGTGNTQAALRELESVQRNDPLNDFSRVQLLQALEISGQSERAEREIQEFLRTPWGSSQSIHGFAVRMALGQRDKARLTRTVQSAIESGNMSDDTADWLRLLLSSPDQALRNLRRTAEESRLQGNIYFASDIAQDAAYLGDRQLALEGLKAFFSSDFNFETTAFVMWRPVMKDVRGEPEFKTIVRELGLEKYWRTTGNWGDLCAPVGDEDFQCH